MMTRPDAIKLFKQWHALSTTITLVTWQYYGAGKTELENALNVAVVDLQNTLLYGGWSIDGTELEPELKMLSFSELAELRKKGKS